MLKGLYTAYTGMVNEQHRMDTMANNLANSATVGFKKEGATQQSFDSLLAYKLKDSSEASRMPRRIGVNTPGVKIGENFTDYGQGSFQETGNTFDLALSGSGFFAIEYTTPEGETSTKYTRAGSFTLTSEGYLVTKDGNYVLDKNNQRIKIDPLKETSIDVMGNIAQNGVNLAQIQVADFEDYDYLEKYGDTMYQPVEGAQLTNATASVNSGYLEMSNVNVVTEMVNMIAITRAYESNQKILQTYDGSLEIATTQLGRLR